MARIPYVAIQQDHSRFKQIVKGKIKKELRKYMSKGELIGKRGKDLVSIPLPQIDLPKFKYGQKKTGGVGQGDGAIGTPIGRGDQEGEGIGKAGDSPADHIVEVEVTLEELAKILGEELELPKIEPKGKKNIHSSRDKFTGINTSGPESLRHHKRTYKQALKRQIASGTYDPGAPIIIPHREDRRYRTWKTVTEPEANAVIIYIMDVSGSMGDEQKEIVRIESFWIDTWLRSQYEGIESRYIIHDATAKEVDQDTFYRTRESGGTLISSAYKLCARMIDNDYPHDEWNIYPFHFSDGDNWSGSDTAECMKLLEDRIIPKVNVFCYGQVESEYGSGQFFGELEGHFGGGESEEGLILSRIEDKDAIYQSIKDFLGKGK